MELVKTNRDIARGILRRYMADFSNQRTPPKSVEGGFYAILMTDTGEVWLSECGSFKTTITRFHSKTTVQPDCITKARARGAQLELWFLTQPQRFSAQALENELFEADLLASRKQINKEGSGFLYVIRHRSTLNYFVVTDRQGIVESTILSNFYTRLASMRGNVHNTKLSKFVTEQASDILNQRNFDIVRLGTFLDKEDEWLKRQLYIDGCTSGENLNLRSVD